MVNQHDDILTFVVSYCLKKLYRTKRVYLKKTSHTKILLSYKPSNLSACCGREEISLMRGAEAGEHRHDLLDVRAKRQQVHGRADRRNGSESRGKLVA